MPVQSPVSADVTVGEATMAPDFNLARDDAEQALRAWDFGTAAEILAITPAVGDSALATDTSVVYVCIVAGTWTPIAGGGNVAVGRGYIDGLTMALGGDTLSITVAVGAARSDDNTASINRDASITKSLANVFATGTGNGMRDSAVSWPPSSGWFYLYIMKDDAAVEENDIFATDDREWEGDIVDIPAAFDRKRYIGAVYYDAATNEILDFFQLGDYFRFKDPVESFSETPGLVGTFYPKTLHVPGVEDGALAHIAIQMDGVSGGSNMGGIVRPLGAGDSLQSEAAVLQGDAGQYAQCLTDGDSQVEYGIADPVSSKVTLMTVTVIGWEDQRGKNAA